MGEDSNFYSTDSESEVFNQLYYPSILWNLRIRTACYRAFLVISSREHLHPTSFKSHIFVGPTGFQPALCLRCHIKRDSLLSISISVLPQTYRAIFQITELTPWLSFESRSLHRWATDLYLWRYGDSNSNPTVSKTEIIKPLYYTAMFWAPNRIRTDT